MFKERAQIGQDRRSNSSHCEESFTCKMGNANCLSSGKGMTTAKEEEEEEFIRIQRIL